MKLNKREIKILIESLNDICKSIDDDEIYDFNKNYIKLDFSYKEFELPKIWCISAKNKENAKILYNYQNKLPGQTGGWDDSNSGHWKQYFINDCGKARSTISKPANIFEITIEQFKEYVLNK